ncbi:S8 family serine peptidase, partial [Acinetobacter baumannii]
KVAVSMDFGTGSSNNDHGTNVSAIVTGVAPNTKILMLNVFSGNGAFFSDLIDAINWAIANKSTYNIASLNMSLGDGVVNTTTCASSA